MPITDYNKKKKLEVSSTNDSGTTQDKAQPVLVKGETTFDVSEAGFTDSFSVSSQDGKVQSVAFNDSGSKMFVIGDVNDKVYEYSLSTSFDVSTASFTDSFDLSGQDTILKGISFNDSGSKMYVCGASNNNVYEYSLSSSFDVSTASFTDSFDVSSQTGGPEGVALSDSGSKMFVVGSSSGQVFEYSLSTSFDVSTASFTDSFDVSSEDGTPRDISFSDSGNKMFVPGTQNGNVYEYSLLTNFDISTASFTDSFNVSSEDGLPTDAAFNDSGSKMFVLGRSNDSVFEYSIGESESKTGTGDVVIDFSNINSTNPEEDIAVYDENGNLLNYEVESLDTSAETGVIWAYDSWVRDDTVQAQIAYGSNSSNTDRQNVTGTWNHTGQNTVMVQHLQDNPLTATDSTSNNNDGTVSGAVSTSGEFNGAASFDGADDNIDTNYSTNIGTSDFTFVYWINPSKSLSKDWDIVGNFDGSTGIITGALFSSTPTGYRFWIDGNDISGGTIKLDEWNQLSFRRQSDNTIKLSENANSIATGTNSGNVNSSANIILGARASEPISGSSNFPGDVDALRIFTEFKDDEWIQADYDASPKAGQVYFSQQAAEAISTVTDQTVTVPETQTTSSNPDPQINPTVDVSVPTSTASTVNPAPTVSPGAAPINLTASTASTANPEFTVQPGNTTVQTSVSTATVSNPDPAINAFNEVTVPETNASTVNPAPSLTVGQTIIAPETTVTSSNPDLTLQPGETSLNISTTQVSASNPVIGLNRQIVVGVATNLKSENPSPSVQPGAVSVQVPETTILTENPALQLQPGATSLQTEQATNLQTVNPDFNTVSGAAELQLSETQLTASIQEPSIALLLQFVSPTNALITNDERFFDMPDHTFTEGDLGDTLQATLKDEVSPEGVDLTGATEIRLVVKDRDGVKVFDKEMSLADRVNGKVEYKWSQGDFIEEPGVYRSKIKVFDFTDEPESFPNDGFRTIEVEEEIS
jgi:hypothetical protein